MPLQPNLVNIEILIEAKWLVRPVSCLDSDAAGDRTGAPCRPTAISVGKKHYFKLLQCGSASLTSPAVQALAKANGGVGGGERF